MARKRLSPFNRIHWTGQVRRLKPLVETVLQRFYGLSAGKIKTLSPNEFRSSTCSSYGARKFVLQVDTPDRERYVLRVHLAEGSDYELNPSTAEILSELQWLVDLRRDTDAQVPEVVLTQEGAYLVEVPSDGTPENVPPGLRCVLFRWLPGKALGPLYYKPEKLRDPLTAPQVELVGTFMARLHAYAETFRPSEGFIRRRIDHQAVVGPQSVFMVGDTEMQSVFTPEHWAAFPQAVEQIRLVMDRLGKGPGAYGLIHSRLIQEHLLLYRNKAVQAVNFSRCGWGHYLYDISVFLRNLNDGWGRSDEQLHDAFFEGYERVRALSTKAEKQVRVFMAIEFAQHILRAMRWGKDSIYQVYMDFELHYLADSMIHFSGMNCIS